jgi:hypothetical protein
MLFKGQTNHSLHQVTFSPDFRNSGDSSLHNVELLPSSAQRFNYADGSYMKQSLRYDGKNFLSDAQMYDKNNRLEVQSQVSFQSDDVQNFDFNDNSTSMVPNVYQLIIAFRQLHGAQSYTSNRGTFREQVGAVAFTFSNYDQVRPFCEKIIKILNPDV